MRRTHLFSAGSNARGQLATGDCEDAHRFSPCSFETSTPGGLPAEIDGVVQIACGANHTLALLKNSVNGRLELWGCGDGSRGQLGTPPSSSLPTVQFRPLSLQHDLSDYSIKSVASGWETSYLVLSKSEADDIILSFGSDDFGALGVSQTKQERIGQVNNIKLPLPGFIVCEKPHKISVTSLAASVHHVIAVVCISQDDQTRTVVYGWGTSRVGQLGHLVKSGRPLPFTPTPVIVYEDPLSCQTISCAVGTHHTVLLDSEFKVTGLGSNRKQQTTGLEHIHGASSIGCTWNGSYVLVPNERGWSFLATGVNNKGQLGSSQPEDPPAGLPAIVQFPFTNATHELIKFVCGSEHVLCLFTLKNTPGPQSEVWGWGWNEHGNMGLGHLDDVHVPVKVWPPSEQQAPLESVDIWAGCGTSWLACLR